MWILMIKRLGVVFYSSSVEISLISNFANISSLDLFLVFQETWTIRQNLQL